MAGLATFTVLSVNGDTSLAGTRLFNKNRITGVVTKTAGTLIRYMDNNAAKSVIFDDYIVSDSLTTVDDIFGDYSSAYQSLSVYDSPSDITSDTVTKIISSEDIVYGLDIDASNSLLYVKSNGGVKKVLVNEVVANVVGVNTAPVVANPISDKNYYEYFGTATIELETNPEGPQLYGVFGDADGDALTYSVTVDDESVATASVTGSVITISEGTSSGTLADGALPGNDIISTTVNVTATDPSGESVTDRFVVNIRGVNDAPTVVTPVPDQSYSLGFGSDVIDLTGRYTDADGDAVTVTVHRVAEDPYAPPYTEDLSVVTASIAGTDLTITEVGAGTVHVILYASDGTLSTEDVFTVTVS